MKHLLFVFFLALCIFAADSASAASPQRSIVALIVTSNHGVSGARPDLRYADDDGVKYAELFRALSPDAHVILHTDLDRDTERLYPWAKQQALPPTKAAVAASIESVRQRVATAAGIAVDFYFVFAGHGDVDAGVGFLELRDARFTAADMEAMLRSIPSARSHVILDSCNSFFVLNARKPGGRKVASTAEEARSLGQRLPNVGVFLSTSSEAEVFEWSELQAGVFSHAVRSGLAGAADANGDGEVSYDELRAFLAVASARIKNPSYRPKVFARGPGGVAATPIATFARAHAKLLRIDGPATRLTLRDADDVPVVDLHKEAGAVVTLRLPDRWATRSAIEELEPNAPERPRKRFTVDASGDAPLLFAELTPAPQPSEARGAADIFKTLFAVPFGPRAMAHAIEEVRKEDADAVYGVSEDQIERMRVLSQQAAGAARGERYFTGTAYVGFGAVLGTAGGWLAYRDTEKKAAPYEVMGFGGLMFGYGAYRLLASSNAEDLYATYTDQIRSPDRAVRMAALAAAERSLFTMRHSARTVRTVQRVFGIVLISLSAIGAVLNEVEATQTDTSCFGSTCTSTPRYSLNAIWSGRLGYGAELALGTTLLVSSFVPAQIERLADIWESDPGRVGPTPQVVPLTVSFAPTRGGGELRLGLTF